MTNMTNQNRKNALNDKILQTFSSPLDILHLLQHYKSIIFIEDDTEGIIMLYSPRCLLLIAPKSGVSLI